MSDNYFNKIIFLKSFVEEKCFSENTKNLRGQTTFPAHYYCTKLLIKSNVVIVQANKQNIHQAVRSQEFDDQIQPILTIADRR